MDRGPADLVLLNARVLTMDDRHPQARALAVRSGRIAALDSDALRWAGERTRVIDLAGRFVMPGFHDSHNHMLMTGLALTRPDLSQARRLADVLLSEGGKCHDVSRFRDSQNVEPMQEVKHLSTVA